MSQLNRKDFLYDPKESDYLYSLTTLTGKKIVDILGYPSKLNGSPVFQITQIIFENDHQPSGRRAFVEGEHDTAYIDPDDTIKNLDDDTLQHLIDQE